ncbi:UNVERIFIED_CONTAM: hypothetical protein Sradi_4603700 [Sesamum radiatum]|uniref:NERD domain-containing protein n=1 Tax=Sesamum radiatum TaxID=300843 RepID=A0AAW2NDE2_SESRA
MWVALIGGFVIYLLFKFFFYEDDTLLDLDSFHANALFAVAKRLEKLYHGSKVYVGIQIPDPDSASRRNIDLVLVTDQYFFFPLSFTQIVFLSYLFTVSFYCIFELYFTEREAVVISVKNVAGFVSSDEDGNWVCTGKHHKTEHISNPVAETKNLVSILEEYLEQREVALPDGFLSFKVICPNPNFRAIRPDSFPPEVITYDQWTQLKPGQKNLASGWIKSVLRGGKDKMQESFCEKLNSVLSTAPISDRLELKGNRYVLGEFLEFKGKQEELQALRKIKRSKVSRLSVQKISMLGFAHSTVQVLYTLRDYRAEGPSQREEVTVRSSTLVLFQPQNSEKPCKYKLSSVVSLSLSA